MGMRENLTTVLIIQIIPITGDAWTIMVPVIVIVVLLISTTYLSWAGTTLSMVLLQLGNTMENKGIKKCVS